MRDITSSALRGEKFGKIPAESPGPPGTNDLSYLNNLYSAYSIAVRIGTAGTRRK